MANSRSVVDPAQYPVQHGFVGLVDDVEAALVPRGQQRVEQGFLAADRTRTMSRLYGLSGSRSVCAVGGGVPLPADPAWIAASISRRDDSSTRSRWVRRGLSVTRPR
jgi:hypothetical protein